MGNMEMKKEKGQIRKNSLIPVLVCRSVYLQTVFGLERLVDMTIAKKVPQIAYGTTVAIRFVNNVIGGENFIDMARWAGVQ
jgi:hypothetical protein